MRALSVALLLIICFSPLNTFGGCIKGDCMNGQGTFIYPDGDKYR